MDYYHHNKNSRNDSRLIEARMRHGPKAIAIHTCIMELLTDRGSLSVSDYNLIAYDIRNVSASEVKSIVEDFGLFSFTDDGKRFYSDEINALREEKERNHKARAEAGRLGGLAKAKKAMPNDDSSNDKAMPKQCQSNDTNISKDINISKSKEDKPTKVGSKTDNKLSALGNAHTQARAFFEAFYAEHCGQSYYFTAKDAGQLKNLLRAITHNLKEAGKPTDEGSVLEKLRNYVCYAYDNNKWVREHFSIAVLSSQYNEIRSSLTTKENGRKSIRPKQLNVEQDPSKFDDGFK